ncbi:hypothetical protein [Rubritalea sp.]|uniref:hypothetical protein n=1 Tax=Rubritalea sp. TaxID=2109375 RepID=UPI003242A10F
MFLWLENESKERLILATLKLSIARVNKVSSTHDIAKDGLQLMLVRVCNMHSLTYFTTLFFWLKSSLMHNLSSNVVQDELKI